MPDGPMEMPLRDTLSHVSTTGARSQRVDARGEPRQLPRDRVLVQQTLSDRPMKFGLGELKSRSRRVFVAARDRCLDLLDEGAHATHPGWPVQRALGGLAYGFFCRFMTGHARSRC